MNPAMRVPVLLVCTALCLNNARAEILSDADRESLLENLEKLRESANSKVDARFRVALAAYREAIGSDDAAMELYLNCIEKVNFEDQQKKSTDFREWKRSQAEKLADPGLRLALRQQLRWLVLTLQAASEKADRTKLVVEAQDIVDSIFHESEKLKNQESILSQAVTSSVFARAYDINSEKLEKWPLSPIQLDQLYGQVLLPPYRKSSRLAGLRATWIKRIQQEGAKIEHWSENDRNPKEEKRIGMASGMQSPAYEKFLAETQPSLQWEMETDLFRHGDESGAAVRMLAHLEKNLAHPAAREWGKQFEALLKPAAREQP
ncbi:MAG: hypothetical protein RLZZ398_1205 [Verrucomicrobiota bacterium]|jgi:hypothetical protein